MTELLLILLAFTTSVISGVFGLGGGLILIAFMLSLLPPIAIVPIHAVTQLISNGSRAVFSFSAIRWEFAFTFLLGSIVGSVLAAQVTVSLNLDYIPLLIAGFILFNVWGGGIRIRRGIKGEFFSLGLLQTGLGMLVGATGPLTQSTLVNKGLARDSIVATSALLMSITHILKMLMFGLIGFSFMQYAGLITGMVIAVVTGSYLGTRMRHRVPNVLFQRLIKYLLTLLAIKMIVTTLYTLML